MNQILIIRNLNSWIKGEKNILNTESLFTPDWMIDKGMYVCPSCGNIQSVDVTHCVCGDEKFIVRESYSRFTYRKGYVVKMRKAGFKETAS